MAEPLLLQILMLRLAGLSRALSLLATVILIRLHNLLLAATPPTVVTTTSVQHLLVLTAKLLALITLPMIFALKAGDSQPITNKVVLLAMPPLSPLYIAGSTAVARSSILASAVAGGLLLRAIAAISTA